MNTDKSNNIVCTFSGGRSSAFMAIYLKTRFPSKNIIFLFCNTSKENDKALEFIQRCDNTYNLGIVWLEAVVYPDKGKGTTYEITNFENAKRNGEIFESVIKKYGLPSKLYRHCTREMKEKLIKKYSDNHFGKNNWIKALGMRRDEPHRTKAKKNTFYPLDEIGATKQFINEWWSRQSFNLELREHEGNCDLCFLKSKRKRITLLKENPDLKDKLNSEIAKVTFIWIDDGKNEIKNIQLKNENTGEVTNIKPKNKQ